MVPSSFHLRFRSLTSRTPLYCDWWETASLTLERSTVGDILRIDKDSPSYLLMAVGEKRTVAVHRTDHGRDCARLLVPVAVAFHYASDRMEHLIQIA